MAIELNEKESGTLGQFIPASLRGAGLLGRDSGQCPDALYLTVDIPGGQLSLQLPFRQALDIREVVSECVRRYPELLRNR